MTHSGVSLADLEGVSSASASRDQEKKLPLG